MPNVKKVLLKREELIEAEDLWTNRREIKNLSTDRSLQHLLHGSVGGQKRRQQLLLWPSHRPQQPGRIGNHLTSRLPEQGICRSLTLGYQQHLLHSSSLVPRAGTAKYYRPPPDQYLHLRTTAYTKKNGPASSPSTSLPYSCSNSRPARELLQEIYWLNCIS